MNRWKNGKAKSLRHANPSGSISSKELIHAQRIGSETLREYNLPTSHRHLEQVNRYAELIGNYKNLGIKSLRVNKTDAVHPSALQMVMQQSMRIKISDMHSQNKFGFKMSADIVYGFSLFDNTRIVKISA